MILTARYALGNLAAHRSRTAFTVLGVGLVVAVFCYLLCFAEGLRRALALTGDPHNLIVLAEPATAESNSIMWHDQLQQLTSLPQIALDSDGRPLVSSEVLVQTNVTRRGDGADADANVAVRGVELETALQVRPQVQLVAGRWFQPGTNELVVGIVAARQFVQGALGATLDCGERTFTVVGVFRAGGGAHESEFWGHLANLTNAYRYVTFSSAVVRLQSADPGTVAQACARIASAAVALRAIPEPAYFASQSASARVLRIMALVLVCIMGGGAIFAALNTMYASVAGRNREFGVLKAIGFSRRRILAGILAESLAMTLAGGLLGCLACAAFILLHGQTQDLIGSTTFTSVAFRIGLSRNNVVASFAVAVAIGVLGGWWPARNASRTSVVTALRTV